MDTLVSAALQELAIEGPEGCTLTKLWSLIQDAAAEARISLAGRQKQYLWQELLQVPAMVLSLPKSVSIPASDPRVQLAESAEKLGVNIVAPEGLRDGSLGLYDLKVCDARLSKEQRDILERIAKSRTNGITQSQLSKELKVTGNKIFYLVKMLESRGLVVRQTTLVRTEESKTPIVATNLLHLTRYAKDLTLSSHQRFEILRKSKDDNTEAGDSLGDDAEGDELVAKTKGGDYVIQDDFPAMEKICQKLEETEDRVLVVGDLKGSLGYRQAVGHRTWRRLMKRLQDAGVVEVFNAQIDRKIRPCVRLLKSFDKKALGGASEETDGENSVKRGKIADMVMELSIDQQIYHLVDQSGSDGVQMMEVFNRLGLQNKRNYCRVATMLARQCLVSEAENHKRSTLYRLKTADRATGAAAAAAAPLMSHNDSGEASPEVLAIMPRSDSEQASLSASDCPQTSGFIMDAGDALQADRPNSVVPSLVTEVRQGENDARSSRKQPETALDIGGKKVREKARKELLLLNRDILTYEKEDEFCILAPIVAENSVSITSPVEQAPTRTTQNHSGFQVPTTTRAQRELRILEKLQAERFILRVELHRWLEDIENRKDTMLDRKTLSRILQAFQREGRCKCVLLSMPGLTNCGRQRTVEVVLLPSVSVDEKVLNKVHEKVRKFDMECRGYGLSRAKKKDDVPVLDGVKRMHSSIPKMKHRVTKFDTVKSGSWSMQSNGFINAKMVRVSMLHHFLWSYVTSFSDDSPVHGGFRRSDGTIGGHKTFSLASAVKRMPLELFLQIIGSVHRIEDCTKWCEQGLRLCDLPTETFSLFLDVGATGRLSWLVDVLRRLKLVRLVMGSHQQLLESQQDLRNCSLSAVLTYAMESEPYLEEPAPSPLPSFSLENYDTSPRARHEFSIATKDGLDAYWQTLEYFYSGAQPAVARHSFPGSSVPELFGLRSWTTIRVMSTEQRQELLKRIGAGGMDKRKSAQECAQIAKDLNLSLYQVLRVSYEKNRIYRLQKLAQTGQTQVPKKRITSTGQSGKSSNSKAYRKLMVDVDEVREQSDEEEPHADVDEGEGKEREDEEEAEGIRSEFSFVSDLRPSRPPRARRIVWSEELDRLLISVYAKQRAQLGAGFPRVDWNTVEQLPAPPAACRRRMSMMKADIVVRKAVLSLCSLVAARYVRHLELQRVHAGFTADLTISSAAAAADSETSDRVCITQSDNPLTAGEQSETENTGNDYSWDDMTEPFLAAALDEIIRCRKVAKASGSKRSAPVAPRKTKRTDPEAILEPESNADAPEDTSGRDIAESLSRNITDPHKGHVAFAVARAMSSLWPSSAERDSSRLNATDVRESHAGNEDPSTSHVGGPPVAHFTTAAGPSRRMRKSAPKLLRKPSVDSGLSTEQQVRKSIGVSNAVEIVKLVLLNSMQEKELVGPLVETVQRFREDEVFTAVKYLREHGLLMAGQGAQTFVLSPKFFHDCAASRFPVGAGHQWRKSAQWVTENLDKMEEDWLSVPPEQQESQLAHLLSLVSTGEFAFNPSLPAKDIGEVEERTGRRPASHRPSVVQGEDAPSDERRMSQTPANKYWSCERRERGFPGIDVSLMHSNRTLPCILSEYCGKNFEEPSDPAGDRLLPELGTSNNSQDYSPMIIEQAEIVTLDDDTPVPGMTGEKDGASRADGGRSASKNCEDERNQTLPEECDRSSRDATKHCPVMDSSAGSTRPEGCIDVGQESDGSLRRTEGNDTGNDGQGTIGKECYAEDSAAADGRESVVVNDLLVDTEFRAQENSGTEPRGMLDCQERVPEESGIKATASSEDVPVSGSLTRVPTTVFDPCLDAEFSAEDKLDVTDIVRFEEHTSARDRARIWALEDCVRFISRSEADCEIDDSVRRKDTELLRGVYVAVARAGAEGLAMETLVEDLQKNGVDVGGRQSVASDCVEFLESFGLVKKVNAFDHVRVLEISHSKRFFINPVPSKGNCRKRNFSSETDIPESSDKRQKNFSSDVIERAGRFDSMDRRRLDQTSGYTAGSSRTGEHRVISLRHRDEDEGDDSSVESVGIVPWLDRHGSLHPSMFRSLSRRVMGIVVGHPGISEDMLIEQLKVLNPQSARQLLQLLEADGHLVSRPVMQHKVEVPRLLRKLVKESHPSQDTRYVKHYFSYPMSGGIL